VNGAVNHGVMAPPPLDVAANSRSLSAPEPHQPVKVMVVVGSLEIGGAQKHIFDLLRQVDRARFDVSVLIFRSGGHFYEGVRALGIKVHNLDVRSRWDLFRRFRNFVRHVRKIDPDVLHVFLYYSSLFGCLVRLLHYRYGPRVILSKRSMNVSLRPDRNAVYRHILMRVPDAITAVSEPVRQRCLELGASPSKVHVIENGIEPIERVETGNLRRLIGVRDDVLLLGTVGSLTVRKRHKCLLHALPSLVSDFPHLHVVIIGEGALRSELEADCRRLGIEKRVHLTGNLAPATRYIGDLSVFVLPSAEEGMSNAMLEAMMVGLPCIASDIASNRQVVSHGRDGLLVNVEDTTAFANVIRVLLSDGHLRCSIANHARQTIRERFGSRSMIEANENLYGVLGRQRRESLNRRGRNSR
jgi:glycosyltransferase involved in cell wall biosynthesis